ncbi:TNF receptor-associated factor 5-like [Halichondria panicea]|uniref:TNF receptor-associated factor 5-like n=1 Tax=Halichondria panicea TaxID=6063 RepID=UPI00312B608F
MASSSGSRVLLSGGYDCQFLQEPPDDLKCLICLCVARDPLQHGDKGCGKIYCRQCITEYKKKNDKCPNCRRLIVTFRDVRSERDIQSLKVKCQNSECLWVGELRYLEEHLKTCDYTKLPCPNKCEQMIRKRSIENSIIWKVIEVYRKDLRRHLKTECPQRQFQCPHCHETGTYEHITKWHIRHFCPKVKIRCPNSPDCDKTFLREIKSEHVSICPYQKLICKYKEFGCIMKPFRKDLKDHENNDKLHLRITMDTLLAVQTQCRKWTEECSVLRAPDNSTAKQAHRITFKMNNFGKYKEKGKEFHSPFFHTHPEGYKMIIEIKGYGFLEHEGTHISVCTYLMKGEYDDQLEFPFQGTLKIELLNQLQNRNHHQQSYDNKGYCRLGAERVTDCEKAFYPFSSMDAFIPHTELELNTTTNCQYLLNDTLIFRASVEVPSYKPWLQCTA